MLDQLNDIMEEMMGDERLLPNIAKFMKSFFDELVSAGFTDEQATMIAANYKMTG